MSLSRFLVGFLVALIIIISSVQIVVTSTPALLFIITSQAHFVVNNSPAQLVVTTIPNRVLIVAPLSINRNARSINSEGKLARSALTDLLSSTVLTPSTLSGRHSSRSKPSAQQQRNLHRLWFTSTNPTGCGGLIPSLFSGVFIWPPPDALLLSPNEDSSAFSLIGFVDCLVGCILVIPCWFRHGNVEVRSVVLSSMSTPPQKFNSFRVSMKVKMSPLSDCSTGTTRVHLAQRSDVLLKLRTLFVQPSQIHLVSSESLVVGTRAGLARSASFQTLLFGLFNVDSDYYVLVVVT
ncbi:hypothetical protein HID58_081118 [Brassica napus]|uniref:Uncharacterized protein n=4 Tax=Brassica TaxID=3705 RepID=A0ABQ7Y8F5_BRANA|nr:hypothetical protein HID58_081118 [Brassica napus]CDY34586.1 BnaC03g56860D [Brassica napus]VDD55985.1 unnamed protein product [Brassica oleracea]